MKNIIALSFFLITIISCSVDGFDKWSYTKSTDEFGDYTGSSFLSYATKGNMSNSVTTSADVTVIVGVDDESIFTQLLDYGKIPVNLTEGYIFKSKVKADGQVQIFTHESKGGILICNESQALIELLKNQTEPLKFALDLSSSSNFESGSYQYTIDPKGFNKLYKK